MIRGEVLVYELVKTIFSSESEGKDIDDYITIARTNFPDFEEQEECRKDIDLMVDNGGELSKIIEKVKQKRKIIHVINDIEQERKFSRSVLVDYLVESCRKTYKESLDLQNLSKKNSLNMSKIEGLEKKINEETWTKEETEDLRKEINKLRQGVRQATKECIGWNKVIDLATECVKLANVVITKCEVM